MSYTKVHADWKDYPDTTTPVDQAALEQMETGIFDAHAATAKGDLVVAAAANDLRRLAIGTNNFGLVADSAQTLGVKWVDLGTLLVPKSVFTTKGDIVAASASGDASRLGVGSNGQVLTADSAQTLGIKWATPAAGSIALSAALPGAPADGDKIILVDSTSAPTYQWLLQYVSAKASNKWVFLGGRSGFAFVATAESTGSTAEGDLATVGPSFTVPVAGDYIVEWGSEGDVDTNGTGGMVGVSFAGVASGSGYQALFNPSTTAGRENISKANEKTGLSASALVRLKYSRQDTAGNARFFNRWLRVTPLALGG